jgi:hypothetical protein
MAQEAKNEVLVVVAIEKGRQGKSSPKMICGVSLRSIGSSSGHVLRIFFLLKML